MERTTFEDAFERAGYVPSEERLRRLAAEAESFGAFMKALDEEPELALRMFSVNEIQARARLYFGRYAPKERLGGGHCAPTDGHGIRTPAGTDETRADGGPGSPIDDQASSRTPTSARQNEESAGHLVLTDGHAGGTRHSPGHSKRSGLEFFAQRAVGMSRALRDVYKFRNGKVAAETTLAELENVAHHNRQEAHLCNLLLLLPSASYIDPGAPLKDWCSTEEFERCYEQSRSRANAA